MDNAILVRELYDALNARRFDVIDELLAESFVDHEEMPGVAPTRNGVRQFFELVHTAFAGFRMNVEDIAASGNKVWVRLTMRGTQRAEFLGSPSRGKSMAVPLVDIFRIEQGRIVEHWGVMDSGALRQHLS